jgi:uncharacterized damage-inducible protein DinB
MKAIPQEPVPDVVAGCLEACRRCGAAVAAIVEQNPSAFPSVSPHLRHCIDHFGLLLDGWRSGSVDYDARPRDRRLEQDPRSMREALDAITGALAALRTGDLTSPVTVTQSAAPGRPPLSLPSRLDRELVFLSGHTVHHIAIMVFAARATGVELPSWLAVAYSTEAHRESLAMNR